MSLIQSLPLLLSLFIPQTGVDDVVTRYSKAHLQPPKIECRFNFESFGISLNCRLLADARKRAIMRVNGKAGQYIISMQEPIVREIDSSQMMYDETEFPGQVQAPHSRLADAAQAFPGWIYIKKLTDLEPPGKSNFTSLGAKSIMGKKCDGLAGSFTVQTSNAKYEIWVDEAGLIRQFHADITSQGRRVVQTWTVVDWNTRSSFKPDEFTVNIPIGYSPYALDYHFPRLAVGDKFPMTGWKSKSGGSLNLASLAKNGRLLVAILDSENPSASALPSLRRLAAKLPIVVVGPGSAAPMATLLDAGAMRKIDPQGTPFFALVDKSGKIVKLWMGFDGAHAAEFEKDVLGV
jgi:hypothetical protein